MAKRGTNNNTAELATKKIDISLLHFIEVTTKLTELFLPSTYSRHQVITIDKRKRSRVESEVSELSAMVE